MESLRRGCRSMALEFSSLEELQEYRREKERLYEEARRMYERGEISDEEFQLVTRKFKKRMLKLERLEERLRSQAEAAEPSTPHDEEPVVEPPVEAGGASPAGGDSASAVEVDDAREQLEDLKQRYARETVAMVQLRNKLMNATEDNQELSSRIIQLTQEKDELSAELYRMKKLRLRLQKKNKLLVLCFFLLVAAVGYMAWSQSEMEKSLEAARKSISDLESSLRSAREENDGLKTRLARTVERFESTQRRLNEARSKLQELQEVVASLRKRLAAGREAENRDSSGVKLMEEFVGMLLEDGKRDRNELLRMLAARRLTDEDEMRKRLRKAVASVRTSYGKALAAWIEGRRRDALKLMREVFETMVQETVAKGELYASMLASGGRLSRELEVLGRLFPLLPSEPSLAKRYARALFKVGRTEKAVEVLRKLLEQDPMDVWASLRLGEYLERKGRTEEARRLYLDSLRYSPDDGRLLVALAGVDMELGRMERAVELLKEALRRGRNVEAALVHRNLATAYTLLGDTAKASEHAEAAAQLEREAGAPSSGGSEAAAPSATSASEPGDAGTGAAAAGAVPEGGVSESEEESAAQTSEWGFE